MMDLMRKQWASEHSLGLLWICDSSHFLLSILSTVGWILLLQVLLHHLLLMDVRLTFINERIWQIEQQIPVLDVAYHSQLVVIQVSSAFSLHFVCKIGVGMLQNRHILQGLILVTSIEQQDCAKTCNMCLLHRWLLVNVSLFISMFCVLVLLKQKKLLRFTENTEII